MSLEPMFPHDPLLARYRQASAQESGSPSGHVRTQVLAYAQRVRFDSSNAINLVANKAENTPTQSQFATQTLAANDFRWRVHALGSVAVLGLCSLLWWQFDHATPEERQVALGARAPGVVATHPVDSGKSVSDTRIAQAPATPPAPATQTTRRRETVAGTTEPLPQITRPPQPQQPAPSTTLATDEIGTPAQTPAQATPSAELSSRASANTTPPPAPASNAVAHASAPGTAAKASVVAAADQPAAAVPSSVTRPGSEVQLRKLPVTAEIYLLAALRQKNPEALEAALARGANPNATTPQGTPAIVLAVEIQDIRLLQRLLQAKPQLEVTDSRGHTALSLAQALQRADMAGLLMAAGAR